MGFFSFQSRGGGGSRPTGWLWLGVFAAFHAVIGCAPARPVVSNAPASPLSEVDHLLEGEPRSPTVTETTALTVERAVSEALAASPELGQLRERIRAASEQVRQAEAAFYPRLVVSEDFSLTNNPVFAAMHIINQRRLLASTNFNDPGAQQDFATKLQGEMILFQGGSRWFDRRAAAGQERAARAELEAGRHQLVARVTEVYYQWLQAMAFIGVAESALESARVDLELGEARFRADVVLPGEVLRLKARKAEMEGNVVTARSGARKLRAALERLMARDIREEEIPTPSWATNVSLEASTDKPSQEFVNRALAARPEMQAVKAMIEAAADRVRAARGSFLPRVGASGLYQWNTEKWEDHPNSWLIGIQATWTLFEGGLSLARMREAEARLREAEARGKQVALDIALEVRQAALAVQEAAEKIKVMAERRAWAVQALEEVRRLYEREVVTVDALLQAQTAWNQAEVAYMASLFDGRIAQTYLKRSLGDFAEALTDNPIP